MKRKGGYGLVYQDVTRNKNISAAAKGLYAYLSAYCGTSDECYPSVDTITREMAMGKDTFYRHINALVAAGVVRKCQKIGEDGKFGRTLYRITHEVYISEKLDFPFPQNGDTEKPDTVGKETKINSLNTNNRKNNSRERSLRFTPPSISDVTDYCSKKGYTVDAEIFINYYESNGWKVGKNKMKDWKAAVRSWNHRDKKQGQQVSKAKPTGFTNFQQRDYDFNDLERQLLASQQKNKE